MEQIASAPCYTLANRRANGHAFLKGLVGEAFSAAYPYVAQTSLEKNSTMPADDKSANALLRIVIAPGVAIGPGKAALLKGIKETGSISAAGRRMGMSYKRAWYLVESLNGHFSTPLVEAKKGGKSGGGAELTVLGDEVLSAYLEMEQLTEKAIAPVLRRLLRKSAR